MASHGKQAGIKGKNFERKMSKELSKWSGETVLRTMSSGAGANKTENETRMTGDLFFPIGSLNPFNYECKDHSNVKLSHFFYNNGEVPEFWQQATTDARRMEYSVPVLLAHVQAVKGANKAMDLVLLPYEGAFFNYLVKHSLPVHVEITNYQDKMTKQEYHFKNLLTTLEGFTHLDSQSLFQMYQHCDWDRFNKSITPPDDQVNVTKILNDLNI